MNSEQQHVHIAGDEDHGVTLTHNLQTGALGVVYLKYTGSCVPPGMQHLELKCEVYREAGILSVHAICPKCLHALWINGQNKKIDYDKERGLFVEPFSCPWEMDEWRREFGMSLCNLRLVFDGHVAREV